MNQLYLNESTMNHLKYFSKLELIQLLRNKELLFKSATCDICRIPMSQHSCPRVRDNYQFKCKNASCSKLTTTKSIRHSSFLQTLIWN
jgi:hypothetical protein